MFDTWNCFLLLQLNPSAVRSGLSRDEVKQRAKRNKNILFDLDFDNIVATGRDVFRKFIPPRDAPGLGNERASGFQIFASHFWSLVHPLAGSAALCLLTLWKKYLLCTEGKSFILLSSSIRASQVHFFAVVARSCALPIESMSFERELNYCALFTSPAIGNNNCSMMQ